MAGAEDRAGADWADAAEKQGCEGTDPVLRGGHSHPQGYAGNPWESCYGRWHGEGREIQRKEK